MSDAAHIVLEETDSKGVYSYSEKLHAPVAQMTFSKAGDSLIIIDHTEVPDEYRGQGVGQLLVERAVADARTNGKRILPLCPFAASRFRAHPEWSDVL